MTPQMSKPPEPTCTITLTENEARWAATWALRANDWPLLNLLTEAMAEAFPDLRDPMDVYSHNAELQRQVRDLGGKRA
jgi:hypothetical protein